MSTEASRICYLNGDYLPLAEARVSVLDRGFIFGDAVYEVIPAYDGVPFALGEHLQRLARSLAAIEITNPMSDPDWSACFDRLLALNSGGHSSLYLQVTRGVAERDHAIPAGITATVFVMCKPLRVTQGITRVAAVTLGDNRWGRCDIKSTSLLANILLRNQAVAAGFDEALLIRDGHLTEGAATNVFVVSDGRVRTPSLSHEILAGVTRGLLLKVMDEHGIPNSECAIAATELPHADEIWLTSSSRDLVCVHALDGKKVGDGEHYPLAERVLAAFQGLRTSNASGAQANAAAQ